MAMPESVAFNPSTTTARPPMVGRDNIGEDYRKSGYTGVLQGSLEGLKEVSKERYVPPYNVAQIYARLEDKQQTLTWLEQAFREHDTQLTYMKAEPAFDEIRSDPRFQQLLQRLAMP